jgi:hypothetical protein
MVPLQTNLRENILKIKHVDDWYREVKEFVEQDTMLVPKFQGFMVDNEGLLKYNN